MTSLIFLILVILTISCFQESNNSTPDSKWQQFWGGLSALFAIGTAATGFVWVGIMIGAR